MSTQDRTVATLEDAIAAWKDCCSCPHRGLASANPRLLGECRLEAHGFGLDSYIEHPMVLKDGRAIAPGRPGHGITFRWYKLEDVRV